jgi:hypothetical protein
MKTTGYKESLNQYQDLVNQPTFADYLGNAFSKVGSQPAVGEAQRMSNAMLSGMGAGISGAAAEERRQKLSPMLEQAGRITAKAAELEAQMQESEQNRLKITQFMKQSAVPIAQLSQASLAGDRPASNELAKGIYLNFKQQADDPTMGDFDHYHNGVIYYHNLETGAIEGENVIGLMYQAGIDPKTIWGQDAPMIEAGLSPGAKKSYEDSEKMRQLEMEGKRADVSLKQAHAGVYQEEANKIKNEVANPKPSPEEYKANSEVAKFNRALIKEEIKPKLVANEALLDAYESLRQIAEESPDIIGSDLETRAYRIFGQAWGLDPNIDYANLKAIEFEKMLKPILGAQLGEKEGERVLSKFASIGNNKIALDKFLKNEIPKVTEDIVEAKQLIDAFNQVQHANLYDNAIYENKDQAIEQYNQERENKKRKNNDNDMVQIISPSGKVGMIPKNSLQAAQEKGFKLK